MTMVIRSTRLEDEPLVLVRAPQRETASDRAGHHAETSNQSMNSAIAPDSDKSVFEHGLSTIPLPDATSAGDDAEPVMAGVMSYEEYLVRFRKELDALRVEARQEARREAYSDGLVEGRSAGEAEYSSRLQKLETLFTSAREAVEQNLDGLADTAIEIVFESVAKILGAQFADGAGIEQVVREVIRQAKERSKLVVRLAPQDYELLASSRNELLDGLNVGQAEFVADELVELGGCVLETPSGSLDGRLEIQMQRFRENLLTARHKWHEHGD